jgi:hypothetical protein
MSRGRARHTPWRVRLGTIGLEARSLEGDESARSRPFDHGTDKPRLADPRFARHDQGSAVCGAGAIERVGDR